MPFATILLIALASVTLLCVIYKFVGVLLDIADGVTYVAMIAEIFGSVSIGIIISPLLSIGGEVVFSLAEYIPLLIAVAVCILMSVLTFAKKRNVILFIPTVVIAMVFALLTSYNAILSIFVALVHSIQTGETIISLIQYPSYHLIRNAIGYIFSSINSFSYTLGFAAVASAWVALAFLFISCGKGFIGIFKRAQKIFFAIFCVALALCSIVIVSDIAVDAFCYLVYIIGRIADIIAGVNLGFDSVYGVIRGAMYYVVYPLYSLIDVTRIMNLLSIVVIFFIGLWLYSPYKAVKKPKKKKVDLVEFVELDCTEDSEVTFEVLDGENDDEFINISVHRPKQHDNA